MRFSLIDQIQAAEARATPGPWKQGDSNKDFVYALMASGEWNAGKQLMVNRFDALIQGNGAPQAERDANADLICLLRNHVPEILEALKFVEDARTSKKAQREAPPHE